MAVLRQCSDRVREKPAFTEKPFVMQGAEALAGAAEKHDDGAAVVPRQVHGGVKSLGAEFADNGQVGAKLGFARQARDAPNSVHGGMMLQKRNRGFGHERVQFTVGKAPSDGRQSGDAHDGVAE